MDLSKVLEKELLEGRFWTHSRTLVEGCTKVSPACLHCWSEAGAAVHSKAKNSGFSPEVLTDGKFNGKIILRPERMLDILPKSNHRAPRVWSYWNDVFHEKTGLTFLERLFSLMSVSKDFHIICTKRPEIAVSFLRKWKSRWPLDNVIIFTTIEDQYRINRRMIFAMKLADMGWNSGLLCEPILEHLNLCLDIWPVLPKWIICGPENGKGKRPFDTDWAASIQMQTAHKGIPFFYKAGLLNGKRYIETP